MTDTIGTYGLGMEGWGDWQPIETAPRMQHVMLWFPRGQHVLALIGSTPDHYECIGYMGNDEPTHWMPLPEPPHD